MEMLEQLMKAVEKLMEAPSRAKRLISKPKVVPHRKFYFPQGR